MKISGSLLWLGFLVPAALALWIDRQPGTPNRRMAGDFAERVKAYLKVRDDAARRVPRMPKKADPEQMAEHRHAFARNLRAARANARQGDIFSPAAAAEFKRIISAEPPTARRAMKVGNPAVEGNLSKFDIAVNADYPGDQPLSMVPPSLLLKLPELPAGLEYRFVDKDLVLLDTEPGLIADYIPQA